jgi:Arc/MetJ-type ribon-helix-helix transcriptional regulator
MSTLNIRLPDSLHRHMQAWVGKEGISVDQFVSSAVAEKLAALTAEDYIAERAARASTEAFDRALAEVPDVPDEFDRAEERGGT